MLTFVIIKEFKYSFNKTKVENIHCIVEYH